MTARKLRGSWYVDITFQYRRRRKKSPHNSKAGAEAYEATLRQKLAKGESIEDVLSEQELNQATLFESYAEEWFQLYVVPNNKFSEQYAKQSILRSSLIPFFGKMSLQSIKTEHVERFKAHKKSQGILNKTINNHLAVLSKCLHCAEDWYGLTMPKVKLLSCPPPKTDCLTSTECESLLKHADKQLREMLFLALRTGMRQAEIRGLQWPSIDWQNRSITVRHAHCDRNKSLVTPKNNRERHIPLDVDVYSMLYSRKKDSGYVFINPERKAPYTSHRILDELGTLCKKAGIRKIGWHALRHTFATQLMMRSAPVTVVKELLGHSAITTTMRYSHVAPIAMRAAIDSLNPRSLIPDFGQPVGNAEYAYEK